MNDSSYLTNHFLIAMPGLSDPNFARTVTYICEHNDQGAMGFVINHPLEVTIGELLEHMEIEADEELNIGAQIYNGGPVQQQHGFVLHSPAGDWDSTLRVTDEVAVTASRDILSAIAQISGPRQYLIALGYAGWGAGQLEAELAENAWLSGPADARILFELPPEERLQAAASLLGVDLRLLSGQMGHA